MATIEKTGRKRPPDKIDRLVKEYQQQLDQITQPVWLAGKSMGGRVSSHLAAHPNVSGIIAIGYPFHPVGKPEKLRVEHLKEISKPMLILQGTRDPFGRPEEVVQYKLSNKITVHWLEDGDHSFNTLKRSRFSSAELKQQMAEVICQFIKSS